MEIEWKPNAAESPYLYKYHAKWNGVRIHRARVLPGRLLETVESAHKVDISLSGILTVEKFSACGKHIVKKREKGNLCITPSGQTTSAFWNKPIENMGIALDPDFVVQTAIENRFSGNFEFREIYKAEDILIQQIGLTLLEESKSESPSGKLYTDSLIQTLTLHLLKNYTSANFVTENHGGLSGYKLRRVQDFINANLEEDLSLAEIAAIADLSQFHFARSFRKTTGQTPQQYLMHQRIERAKDLLINENLPIVEISLRTGFKNQSHFTTLFRKFTKLTPKLWRELKLA